MDELYLFVNVPILAELDQNTEAADSIYVKHSPTWNKMWRVNAGMPQSWNAMRSRASSELVRKVVQVNWTDLAWFYS